MNEREYKYEYEYEYTYEWVLRVLLRYFPAKSQNCLDLKFFIRFSSQGAAVNFTGQMLLF